MPTHVPTMIVAALPLRTHAADVPAAPVTPAHEAAWRPSPSPKPRSRRPQAFTIASHTVQVHVTGMSGALYDQVVLPELWGNEKPELPSNSTIPPPVVPVSTAPSGWAGAQTRCQGGYANWQQSAS